MYSQRNKIPTTNITPRTKIIQTDKSTNGNHQPNFKETMTRILERLNQLNTGGQLFTHAYKNNLLITISTIIVQILAKSGNMSLRLLGKKSIQRILISSVGNKSKQFKGIIAHKHHRTNSYMIRNIRQWMMYLRCLTEINLIILFLILIIISIISLRVKCLFITNRKTLIHKHHRTNSHMIKSVRQGMISFRCLTEILFTILSLISFNIPILSPRLKCLFFTNRKTLTEHFPCSISESSSCHHHCISLERGVNHGPLMEDIINTMEISFSLISCFNINLIISNELNQSDKDTFTHQTNFLDNEIFKNSSKLLRLPITSKVNSLINIIPSAHQNKLNHRYNIMKIDASFLDNFYMPHHIEHIDRDKRQNDNDRQQTKIAPHQEGKWLHLSEHAAEQCIDLFIQAKTRTLERPLRTELRNSKLWPDGQSMFSSSPEGANTQPHSNHEG